MRCSYPPNIAHKPIFGNIRYIDFLRKECTNIFEQGTGEKHAYPCSFRDINAHHRRHDAGARHGSTDRAFAGPSSLSFGDFAWPPLHGHGTGQIIRKGECPPIRI